MGGRGAVNHAALRPLPLITGETEAGVNMKTRTHHRQHTLAQAERAQASRRLARFRVPYSAFRTLLTGVLLIATVLGAIGARPAPAHADPGAPPLAEERIYVVGLELRPGPAHQVVPKNQGTVVAATLALPGADELGGEAPELPALPADAVVLGELTGPAFGEPVTLAATPGGNFPIPPLAIPGLYTLGNIRLVNDGQVLLLGNPAVVRIEVIDRVLVSQVTSRPLSADEIKERGIVIDQRNFQVVNFTVGFGLQDQIVNIDLPMLYPSGSNAGLPGVPIYPLPAVGAVGVPEEGMFPDLAARLKAPNLTVAGFSLAIDEPEERKILGLAEPIPGVVIIPGNVAYLNQFFSVILKVSNVSPSYSNLEVRDLKATIVLPPGQDNVTDSLDDPLRMAVVGEPPAPQGKEQPVIYPGPDGQFKTADDINALAPQQSGDAEYLVEGVREGAHLVNLEITGMLHGLPDGPVKLKGRAVGMVEVRNPTFALTVNHPETVSAGEEYDLYVTITNVSDRPANFASLNLLARSISGAELLSDATVQFNSIPAGDAATATFRLRARKTGTVTATSIAADGVPGKFELRTAVGELGIPMSPISLVLPPAAEGLPASLRQAGIALLNQAFALAGAPVTPEGLLPMGRGVVYDQGVSLAATGQRITLGESPADAARDLLLDFMGNNLTRLDQRYRNARLEVARRDLRGFDQLLRRSGRGAALRVAAAALWGDNIRASGALAFQQDFAEAVASRPSHLSVIVGAGRDAAPALLAVTDPAGRQLGGVQPGAAPLHDLPFGGLFQPLQAGASAVQYALVAAPDNGAWLAEIAGMGAASVDVGLVFPGAAGLRRVTFAAVPLENGSRARVRFTAGANSAVVLELDRDGDGTFESTRTATVDQPVADRAPRVISAVQIFTGNKDATKYGQVVGVLFSEEVDKESTQTDEDDFTKITNYAVEANQVKGVQIQADQRVVLLALNTPVGVYVTRTITVSNVLDLQANPMQTQSAAIRTVATGARLSGVVRRADGSPAPFAGLLLSQLEFDINDEPYWEDVSLVYTDAEGRFSFDRIRMMQARLRAVAFDTNEQNYIITGPRFEGQHLQADVVMVGTGTLTGRAVAADGVTPLPGAKIKAASLTQFTDDGTPLQGLATAGADGSFLIGGLPVGAISILATHQISQSQAQLVGEIPTAGAVVTQTLVLLRPDQATVGLGSVEGQVFRADGVTPAANVPIYTSRGGVTLTNASGAYRFDLLPEGPVSLRAIDPAAQEQADTRTTIVPSGTVAANLVLFGGFGTVRGVVFEEDGAPAANLPIYGGPAVVHTDASGQFVLENVPVGNREISAFDEVRQRLVQRSVNIRNAGDEAVVQLVMPARGVIAGRVLQADGATPAANVRVIIFGPGVTKVFTDDQGRYRAENLPLGEYTVSAFLSDNADGNIATGKLVYNNQVQQINVVFKGRGAAVTGIVYDDDGVTPVGARVGLSELVIKFGKLTPPENPLCLGAIDLGGGQTLKLPPCETVPVGFEYKPRARRVNSHPASGQFTFTQPFVGPLLVEAASPFSPQEVRVATEMPRANATVPVTLSLLSTGVITGTVFWPDGSPVGENVIVRFDSGYISDAAVRTDRQGNFHFPLVNPGTYRLTASDPISGLVGQSSGNVAIGATTYMPLRLLREGAVTVLPVGVDGRPLADADVTVTENHYPNRVRSGNTKTGAITFDGGDSISEGSFTVRVYDRVRGVYRTASGTIPSLQESPDGHVTLTVQVNDAAGAVLGRFVRRSGVGIPNAQVVLSSIGGQLFVTTDASGAFQFDGILAGNFRLESEDPATSRRGAASGAITQPGQTLFITMTEQALGTVTGVVRRQPENLPVAGAQVRLTVSGPFGTTRYAQTGPDGVYNFPAAPVGNYTVVATTFLFPGASVSASGVLTDEGQIAASDLNFTRPLVGQVQGRVFQANGAPMTAGTVTLTPQGKLSLQTTVSITGFYTIRNVPVAPFTLVARPSTGATGGQATGSIAFDGDSANHDITLLGVGTVRGQVRSGAGQPVGLAEVRLVRKSDGAPVSYDVVRQADAQGFFTFTNVVVGDLSATARQITTNLAGAAAGTLAANGATLALTVTLQPAGVVTGVVRHADGAAAPLIGLELRSSTATYYGFTGPDGGFHFDNVKLGDYLLHAFDPQGQGIVDARAVLTSQGQIVNLGNLVLDIAPPAVIAVQPANGVNMAPIDARIVVTFSERVQPATVSGANLLVATASGPFTGSWQLDATGTVATFTPAQFYRDLTTVNLRVKRDVKDMVGRTMAEEFVASFMTGDTTPPALVSRSPVSAALNVALNTPIRLTFSEAVDASAVVSPALRILQNGQPVAGALSWLFDNTVLVFTPAANWSPNSTVRVEVAAMPDRVGNTLPASAYTFDTLDIVPPVIQSITAPAGGTVIAGDTARIVAMTPDADVEFVEFFVNGQPAAVVTAAPFEFAYATPVGASGAISVTARAVDKAGNQGQVRGLNLTVLIDSAPQASITAPVTGTVVAAGSRVTITVAARDDRGLSEIVYQALGAASAASRVAITPAVTTRAADFVLRVPAAALPGQPIELRASAVDIRGQASPVAVTLLRVGDATPPQVTIVAPPNGSEAIPGQPITVTIVASDVSGIARVRLTASGGATFDTTRTITPATTPVTATFAVTVAAGARPTQTVTLLAYAVDGTGNEQQSAAVTLPVRDQIAPAVTAALLSGAEVLPGQNVRFVVTATDEIGVSQVSYRIAGAFALSGVQTIAPAQVSASVAFTVAVPPTVTAGSAITITGLATDAQGNQGAARPLAGRVVSNPLPAVTVTAVNGCPLASGGCDLRVATGARFTVTVAASDADGIATLRLRATGMVSSVQSVTITPTQAATAVFTVTAPNNLAAAPQITLTGEALDTRGLLGASAPAVVTVADLAPPVASIQAPSPWMELTPGAAFTVQTHASDNLRLSRVDVTVTGALTAAASRVISPATNSASSSFVFTLPVQATAANAVTLTVQATDAAGNLSAPVVQRQRIKDIVAPRAVATTNGVTTVLPLGRVAVVVTGTDDIATALLAVDVTGAFTTTLTQQTVITRSAAATFNVQFPADVTPGSLVYLTGRAQDSSGNVGNATPITLTVGRPQGALSGAVTWYTDAAPVPGAVVRIAAGNGIFTVTADANGLYQTLGPVVGSTQVTAFDPATGAQGRGARNISPDDLTPVIDVIISAHPSITVTDPLSGGQVIHNSTVTVTVAAQDDHGLQWVDFYVDGVRQNSVWGGAGGVFRFPYVVPGAATSLTFHAVASDVDGNSTASQPVTVRAVADPLTTVTGRVVNAAGQPVAGASVIANGGRAGVSAADGRFTITGVTTILGPIGALARIPQDGLVLSGHSVYTAAVRGGVTPVGDITLGLRKVWDGGGNSDSWHDAANWNDDRVPAAEDDVYIPVTGTVSFAGYNQPIHSLRSDGQLTVRSGGLSLTGDGILRGATNLQGGQLASAAGITLTGVFSWTNGELAGPGRIVLENSFVAAGDNLYVNNAALVNRGAGSWRRGHLNLTYGASVENAAGASLEIAANATLAHYYSQGAAPQMRNAGVITVATTGVLQMGLPLVNDGAIRVQTGELLLNGALTHNGALTVAPGATLRLGNNAVGVLTPASTVTGGGTVILSTYQWSTQSLSFAGRYTLAGMTQVLNGNNVISPTATFSTESLVLSAGRVEAHTGITVTNVLTWSNVTLAGPGATYVAQRVELDNSNRLLDGHTLRNGGQARWQGTIRGANGALWHNLPGATLEIPGDVNTNWWDRGAQPAVRNEGALRKVAPATTADLNGAVTNTGVIEVLSGTLTLPASTTTAGLLRVSQGATVTLSAATHQVLPSGVISNSGQIILASGVLTVAGRYDGPGVTQANGGRIAVAPGSQAVNLGSPLRLQGATLEVAAGAGATARGILLTAGAVQGSGAITASESFTWTGGSLLGDGSLLVAGRGLLGPGNLPLNNRRLAIAGETIWQGGSLQANNGAVVHVQPGAVLSVTAAANFDHNASQGATSQLQVEGRLAVSVPVAANTAFDLRGHLLLDGAADLASGVTVIHGSGVQRGALTVQPGATLEVRNRYTTETGSTIGGLGMVRQTGGVLALAGAYQLAGVTEIRGGSLTPLVPAAFTPANLALYAPGVLTVTGDITVTQVFTWVGGTHRGQGVTRVAGSTNLVAGEAGADTNRYLLGRTLAAGGDGVWQVGDLRANDGAMLHILPGASLDVQGGGTLAYYNNTGARPTLRVEGELVKSAGAETNVDFTVANQGEVRAGGGVLNLRAGGANQSVFTADAGGTLKFTANFSHTASATVQGLGVVQVGGGLMEVSGAYAVGGTTLVETAGGLIFQPGSVPASLGSRVELRRGALTLRSGQSVAAPVLVVGQNAPTLSTDDPIQVTEVMTWTDGTLQGSGSLLIANTARGWFEGGQKHLNAFHLRNAGSLVWQRGVIYASNGSRITNLPGAQFDLRTNDGISYQGGVVPVLENHGVLVRSTDGGILNLWPRLENSGSLHVLTGTLRLQNGSVITGVVNTAAGAALELLGSQHRVTAAGRVEGAGRLRAQAETVIEGAYHVTGTTETATANGKLTLTPTATLVSLGGLVALNGGELLLNSGEAALLPLLRIEGGGVLNGSGAVTVTQVFTWSNGVLRGAGTTHIAGAGWFDITTKQSDGRRLELAGATQWVAGDLYLSNGAALHILPTATLTMTTDNSISYFNQTPPVVVNEGVVVKAGGNGQKTLYGQWTNRGVVRLLSGVAYWPNTYTQAAGATVLEGGNVRNNNPLLFQGGVLRGRGVIQGALTNAALVDIEPLGSLLQVTGNYLQESAGALTVALQSADPAAGYDRLQVGGLATLSGTLTVERPTGFTPASGESFPVVSYLARTGQFATIAGLDLGNGSELTPLYSAASLTLQAPGGAGGGTPPGLVTLWDGAGMAYTVDCQATLTARQTASLEGQRGMDVTALPALASLYALTVNGQPFPCQPQALAGAESGAALVYGPAAVDGVTTQRTVQAAADGNYVRYVEAFTNDGAEPRTVQVELAGELAFGAGTRVLAAPESTGLPYVVLAGDDANLPLLAQVFGGAGEGAQLPQASYAAGDGRFGLRWPALTLAPGQTVRLVYFVLHGAANDAAGLEAQARSLTALTAAQAVPALPADSAASVANYPPLPSPEPPAAAAPRIFLPLVAGGGVTLSSDAVETPPAEESAPVTAPDAAPASPPAETPAETPLDGLDGASEAAPATEGEGAAAQAVYLPLVQVQ